MTEDINFIGNASTIIKFISMTISGWVIGTLTTKGLNIPIDQANLSQIITTIIFILAAYIDAKYPNTLKILGNNKNTPTEQQLVLKEIVLNEEYETNEEENDDGGEDGC